MPVFRAEINGEPLFLGSAVHQAVEYFNHGIGDRLSKRVAGLTNLGVVHISRRKRKAPIPVR